MPDWIESLLQFYDNVSFAWRVSSDSHFVHQTQCNQSESGSSLNLLKESDSANSLQT